MKFTAIHSVEDRKKNRGGFTLIELLIALLIMGVLLTTIYRVFISQDSMFRAQEEMAKMQENLRATSEFMNQEFSWLGYGIPGLAILYAGTSQVIYKANLPNTGGTDSFIRYTFDATNERIMRAVETTLAAVQNDNNLRVLANDVDSLTFSYYDGFGSQLVQITPSHPAVSPTNDNALGTIRRVRTRFEVKSSRPDWNYTHPTAGDHFRRRSTSVDVKTRNLEDVTVSATGIGTGSCSSFVMNVNYPGVGGQYSSCSDQQSELATATQTLTDNPLVTVTVVDPSGGPDNSTPVSISADAGYIFKDAGGAQRSVITGRTNGVGSLYLAASSTAVTAEGTAVTVSTYFTPPEAGCLQLSQTETLSIVSGTASRFDTTAPYNSNSIVTEYVDLSTGLPLSPQPGALAVCSSASNEGLKIKVRLEDDCGNGIEGQTVNFSAVAGSFQSGTHDNGDGTYDVVYVPPDTIAVGAPLDTDTVTATWVEGSQSRSTTVSLKPGAPDHIVINDITGPVGYGFVKTGTDSFEMWRLQGQTVTTNLSVLDQCGNRVFGEESSTTMTPTNGTTTPDPNPAIAAAGTYTFYWTSEDSCGDAISGQGIQINNTHTLSKTETFDLLTTPPSVFNVAVSLNLGQSNPNLSAGGNAPFCKDQVEITASLVENTGGICGNLADPFTADFSVAGQTAGLGNGSFALIPGSTTISANSGTGGVAHATLYPGDARYDQNLDVYAVARIDGAPTNAVTIPVNMTATPVQDILSGIYDSSGYSNERNLTLPARSFNPGETLFPRVVDCDENERITLRDPSGYPPVQAIFKSLLTGDSVTVNLTEDTPNSADFRLPAGVTTQLNAVADTTDATLQVAYGDLISMYYADKDDNPPPPNLTFAWHSDAYISGPRWMKLYKVILPSTENLITGPAYELSDGDKYRVKVYVPEFDGDSGPSAVGVMTDTAAAGAQYGGETDSFTLREAANTGVFIPDSAAYGVDYNTVSKTANPAAPNDQVWLNIPYTPDRVTVYYPDTASPIFTQSFLIHDSDPPDVSITPPAVSAGTIPIEVTADDTGNLIDPGIGIIRLYIDGINVKSWTSPSVNPVSFDWVTESGGQVFWLNGNHSVYAKAWDKAGNPGTTPVLTVTVSNPGATAINFTQPAQNSVLSSSMNISFQAPDVYQYNNYTCSISGMSSAPADVPMGASNTCTFTWDLTSVPDSTYSLTGTITDNQGNSDITAVPLMVIVDHIGPTVDLGTPPVWVGDQFPVTVDVDVTDANGVDSASVNGDLSGDCTNLSGEPFSAITGTTYRYIWAGGCPAVDGSQTLTVRASDLAVPPNDGSSTVTISVDTIHPVMAPINASPIAGTYLTTGSFVNGVVTLTSSVMDNHAASAFVSLALLPGSPTVISRPLDSTSTGAFHYTWNTSGLTQGLYEVLVSGKDMAANANTNTEAAYLYVDRTAPTLTLPVVNSSSPPAYVTSAVPVDLSVNDTFGFIKRFGVFFYNNLSSLISSNISTYPPIAAVSGFAITSTMDTRYLADGTNYIQSYAADHAGNANSTTRVPFEVCNRVAQITSHSFTPSGVNYSLTVLGSVVQLKPTGPAPVDLEPLDLLVQPASAASFHVAGSTTAGAFSITTPPSDKLIPGAKIDVQLTDTGSGCDPAFAIDKPSYSYTVLP